MQNLQKQSKRDIGKYNQYITRETIKESVKVRKTQKLGQDTLITHVDKQGREIYDHDKIIEIIEDVYTESYDNEQSTIVHTDTKVVLDGSSTTRFEERDSNRQRP